MKMKQGLSRLLLLLLIPLCLVPLCLAAGKLEARESHLLLETDKGPILIELNPRRAPLTVAAILKHSQAGHYDGLIFHRVIDDFVIQTGGYDGDMKRRDVDESVVNESGNGLSNYRGTVALARGEDPHSGKVQFYINLDDNSRLDPRSSRWGYAVFGRVVAGMDTVDAIGKVDTGPRGDIPSDVPKENILIQQARPLAHRDALEWLDGQEKDEE